MGEYILAGAAVVMALLLLLLGGPFERLITGRDRKGDSAQGNDGEDAP
jgi:hypothetical protein